MPYKDPEKQAESRRKSVRKWKEEHPEEDAKHKENWRHRGGSAVGRGKGSKKPWTQEEDKKVLAHAVPDRVLAKELDRSLVAISVRRSRLRDTPGPCGPCSGPGVLSCEHTSA